MIFPHWLLGVDLQYENDCKMSLVNWKIQYIYKSTVNNYLYYSRYPRVHLILRLGIV